MTHRDVFHTIARKANGDVIALLFRSGPENPDPTEIARICKYALGYGRKGVAKTQIQREIWRDAVLGYDDRGDAKVICAKLLNTTAARGAIAKSGRMVEAGNLPPWGARREVQKGLVTRIPETPARRRNRDACNPDRLIRKPIR